MKDFYYIGVIIVLSAAILALLNFYTSPRDCTDAATHAYSDGYIKGMRSTTALFKEI